MKKKISIALFCLLAVVLAVGAWFYAYYNRKSNDNLPALAAIAEMDEADVNTLLIGYKRIQLIEVWGNPDSTLENEDIWEINEDISLRVNSDNKGKIVVCGLLETGTYSNDENVGPDISVYKEAENQYLIEILDDGYTPDLPVRMSIPVTLDDEGNLIKAGDEYFEMGTSAKYDSVSMLLDDQSDTIKFIWITINGLSVYSDDGQFLNRWNFSYEIMFKFDTETLEIFDVQKK